MVIITGATDDASMAAVGLAANISPKTAALTTRYNINDKLQIFTMNTTNASVV
jgi:hypothetical protein